MNDIDPTGTWLDVPGATRTTLDGLVRMWTEQLSNVHRAVPLADRAAMESYLDLFVRGGSDAVRASLERGPWVQLSISLHQAGTMHAGVREHIGKLVTELLGEGATENFFFMRKPPGLRLRFEASGVTAPDLERRLLNEAEAWRANGLIEGFHSGVYEPESRLFGGPKSIPHVHAIFTLDSLVWLRHGSGDARTAEHRVDSWGVSFAVLRSLFDGLGIEGWEDLGVWECVTERTGRQLPADVATLQDYAEFASAALEAWNRVRGASERTGSNTEADEGLGAYLDSIRSAAARWKAGYFDRPAAWIGPRHAAAYVTIFHWNRAGFSAAQQGLIAGTLANRLAPEPASQG